MDPTNIRELLHALKVEFIRFRYVIVAMFIILSALTLIAGYKMPKNYTSRVVLYADVTNIIGNLLEGTAEITRIDRAKEARDIIFTDRILRSVAINSNFEDPDKSVLSLRSKMKISANGDYVNIHYSSQNRDESFNVIDSVTQAFLTETTRKKREESQSAFEFIDAQVITYKRQLENAEDALKDFSAQNIDITESSVASRVTRYKNDIQVLKLEIEDSQSRLSSFQTQLASEPEFLEIETERTPSFEERQLEVFEQQLAELRLSYLDTHPDIVSLLDQISILEKRVSDIKTNSEVNKLFSKIENPAHTNLKEVINTEQADLTARRNRLRNTERLLETEFRNAQTVAAKQATYKELTRDYAVTKEVYEDMLMRRESARLSMTLDIEGQGVSYKVHEPASYPLHSDGLQLMHFVMIGPILGLSVPIGLIVLLILLDKRVRSASFLTQNLPSHINVITTIPIYDGAVTQFGSKRSILVLCFVFVMYLALYAFLSANVGIFRFLGVAS